MGFIALTSLTTPLSLSISSPLTSNPPKCARSTAIEMILTKDNLKDLDLEQFGNYELEINKPNRLDTVEELTEPIRWDFL